MRAFNTLLLSSSLAFANPLFKRGTGYSSGDTASDVQNGVCAPLTVIFARGTSESGNIGTVIGPPLFQSLSSKTGGNVALQGVNYPADLQGDFDGGSEGGTAITSIVQQALSQCPGTKIALGGYSQGGLSIHNALNSAGLASSDVAAIVYFGDPGYTRSASGTVPDSEIKEYCASGDGVCEQGTFSISSAHLSYGSDADDAANFIISTAGGGTGSGSTTPAPTTTTAASTPTTPSLPTFAFPTLSLPTSTSSSGPSFLCTTFKIGC